MFKILLVGCGKLGQCYLQSIHNHLENVKIITVDPFVEIENSDHHVHQLVELDNQDFDLAIVTTCSDIRYQIVKDILNTFKVKYMILEKILFQNQQEYLEIQERLIETATTAWVNCPRRTYQCYKQIKEMINPNNKVKLQVSGSNWGLACNIIHFLDLYAYLSDDYDFELKSKDLVMFDSKRMNFYEFNGEIYGDNFNIKCDSTNNLFSLKKTIMIDDRTININNQAGTLKIDDLDISFKTPYVSEYMGKFIQKILVDGECDLPTYQQSTKIHLKLIDLIKPEFEKKGIKNCPIT